MILTLFTANSACTEIVKVRIAHTTMFKGSNVSFAFTDEDNQIHLVRALIKYYVDFNCQGATVHIDMKQFQRVYMRLDQDPS